METPEKIIKVIRQSGIKPRSRWLFFARDGFVWACFALVLFLAALSLVVEDREWDGDPSSLIHSGIFHYAFHGVSLLLVFFTLIFLVAAYLNLRLTKHGYRYRGSWLMIAIVASICILGILIFHEGLDRPVEHFLNHASLTQLSS